MTIDTEEMSRRLRAQAVQLEGRRLLVTSFVDTKQEADLTDPPNCNGFGRIRHFTTSTSDGWPANTLPILPATARLGMEPSDRMHAQVFQNAVCNWRCWYCYVPFNLLSANPERSAWVTADELVEWYLASPDPPRLIDLSGGQPDLVPEWTLWMVEALTARGLEHSTYLWIDDNLSNDYFWRYLDDDQLTTIASYPSIGRVGCFKGYDAESFAFNTGATADEFDRQFDLFDRHRRGGIDTYAYATFTSPSDVDVKDRMRRFVDRLQGVAEELPLRLIPLEIAQWGPVKGRLTITHRTALVNQQRAIEAWNTELEARFTAEQRATPIHQVAM